MKETVHKKYYLECACTDFGHCLRVAFFTDDADCLYIEKHLQQFSFFRRLWLGAKYIFGFTSPYGHTSETLLDPDEVVRLKKCCEDFLKARELNE